MAHTQSKHMVSLSVSGTFRFSKCWKIVRVDGETLYLTDHDQPLSFGGNTYTPQDGVMGSTLQADNSVDPDNIVVRGVISDSRILDEDLNAGKYRRAQITEYVVDNRYPWAGHYAIRVFYFGDIKVNPVVSAFEVECQGILALFAQKRGSRTSRFCRVHLYSTACGVVKNDYKATITVATVTDNGFTAVPSLFDQDDFFNDGEIEWTAGDNDGTSQIIGSFDPVTNEWVLATDPPFDITVGDTANVYAGCNKKPGVNMDGSDDPTGHCKHKFDNLLNFRGEPFLATDDRLYALPDSPSDEEDDG